MAEFFPTRTKLYAAVHGEELNPGVPLVESLQRDPIVVDGRVIDAEIAHPEAVALGVRYIEVNLSICCKDLNKYPDARETKLARAMLATIARYDLAVDVHENKLTERDCIYIGPVVDERILGLIALCGITDILVSDVGAHGATSNTVLVDVATSSWRNDVGYWRTIFEKVVTDGLSFCMPDGLRFHATTPLSPEERIASGMTSKCHELQEYPYLAEYLGIPSTSVYSLYGGASRIPEVAARIGYDDMVIDGGFVKLPTLRDLARRAMV